MAVMGRDNQYPVSLGSSSGLSSTVQSINRPYPVIVSTNQTATQIEIDIDWYVNGVLTSVTGFEEADLLITGTTQPLLATVTLR